MEELLDTYCLPPDRRVPLICMDEQPVQLIQETRSPLPALPGHPLRIDYEYERNGTATVFLFTEPLQGHRQVHVRERRTATDWAEEIQHLLEVEYPEADRIRLVCDNLNTHKLGSLYEAFLEDQQRQPRHELESTTA